MSEKMTLDQLKAYVEKNGFLLELLDRGKQFKGTESADRFEIWLEGHLFNSKIAYCPTLQEAIDKAYPEIKRRIEDTDVFTPDDLVIYDK